MVGGQEASSSSSSCPLLAQRGESHAADGRWHRGHGPDRCQGRKRAQHPIRRLAIAAADPGPRQLRLLVLRWRVQPRGGKLLATSELWGKLHGAWLGAVGSVLRLRITKRRLSQDAQQDTLAIIAPLMVNTTLEKIQENTSSFVWIR